MASIGIIILLLGLVAFVNTTDLCVKENQSCVKTFFPDETDMMCNIIYYKMDSEECQQMNFIESEDNTASLANPPWLTLQPFSYKTTHTGFNVTALGGKWNHLKMRFKKQSDYETNIPYDPASMPNHCREFNISYKSERKPFSYVCPWTDLQSETFILEVQTDRDNNDYKFGKYIFIIPQTRRIVPGVGITEVTIFIYIEITDLKNPIAHIHLADSKLNITSYNVTTYKVGDDKDIPVSSQSLNSSDALSNVFRFPVNHVEDYFIIGVVPTDSSGNIGIESWSPIIYKAKPPLGPLLLCMIIFAALLPAFGLSIFMWRDFKKQQLERKNRLENEKHTDIRKLPFDFSNTKKSIAPGLKKYNLGDKDFLPEVEKIQMMDTKGLVFD